MGRKGYYGPYKIKDDDPRKTAASDDDIIQASLELEGWFWPHQLFDISHDKNVRRVLNRLVRSGDLEKRRLTRNGTTQFRWRND